MSSVDLDEHQLTNTPLTITRRVWTYSVGEQPTESAILFLDAELYLQRVQAAPVLETAFAQQTPALFAAFVSNQSAAARHVDYVCNADYAKFIAVDVVAWLRRVQPQVRELIIVGLSLSGLAAAYIATRYPDTFRAAICQSPSFWWEQGRFAAELPAAADSRQNYWICVGSRETEAGVSHEPSGLRQEWTQIAGCDFVCSAMRANGYSVEYRSYDGGHDPSCWREDLSAAIPWVCKHLDLKSAR